MREKEFPVALIFSFPSIISLKKEASRLRLFHGPHGVQKVGCSLVLSVAKGNLPAPTVASTKITVTFCYQLSSCCFTLRLYIWW